MYKDYFGFNENPFSIAPNPRYLYMSGMHREALAHLVYGATSEGCIILLTGEVGTGKTTISRCFLEQLPSNTNIAVIINPKLTGDELLSTICDEFQITVNSFEPTTKDYIDAINNYLLEGHASGNQAVLVIDEAQNLDLDVLEMLRLLTNLETDQRKLLKIFLLGQSELAAILTRPDLVQINQRITSRYHLKGLERDDVSAYIMHRISIAGGGRSRLFRRGALNEIFEISRGIPRLINSLCDHALLGAYSENKDKVDKKIIKKAAREIFGANKTDKKSAIRLWHIPAYLSILVILVAALWFASEYWSSKKHRGDSQQRAPQTFMDNDMAELQDELLFSDSTEAQNSKTKIVIQPVEVVER